MATHLLTPKSPNPLSALSNPVLGWQFAGSTALDVFEGCNVISQAGWSWTISPDPSSTANPPLWVIEIKKAGYLPVKVIDTEWFTFDGVNIGVLTSGDVSNNYTLSVPPFVWTATTTAPTATAAGSGTATVVFPQPISVNGPWSYSVTQTNTTTSATGAATLSGSPTVANGNVTLTVTGLTTGDRYTFTATAHAEQYSGLSETSLASNSITA